MTYLEYSEIKAGDKLKMVVNYEHGTSVTIEGTADYNYGGVWRTRDRVVFEPDLPASAGAFIELIDRPVLPYEPGSIIRAIIKSQSHRSPVDLIRVEKAESQDELTWLDLSGTGQNFYMDEDIFSWVALKLEPVD